MADDSTVPIVIKAQDVLSAPLKAMSKNVDVFGSKVNKTFATLQANWLKAAGALYTLKKAFDFGVEAAKFQQMEQGFANLAASHSVNSDEIIDNLKRVSAQTISTADLMKSAGNAMVLGIPAERLEEMMEIARASSRVTGQSIQKSFDDISVGIGRQSRMILDNLGIIVDSKKAYEDYAKAHDKTAEALTESEKKQAFANATMEAGLEIVERVNIQGVTAAEAIEKGIARFADFKILAGKAISFVSFSVTGLLHAVNSGLWKIAADTWKIITWIGEKAEGIPLIGKHLVGLTDAARGYKTIAEDISIAEAGKAAQDFEIADALFRKAEAIKAVKAAEDEGGVAMTDAEMEAMDERHAFINESEDALLDRELQRIEELRAAEEAAGKHRLLTAQMVTGGIATFSSNMYAILGKKGKAFAKIAKAAAITQAIISGKTAAVDAWSAGMKAQPQGWWSPGVAAGFAVASIAKTGALIASIGGSQGGSGGGGTPSVSRPSAQGGGAALAPKVEAAREERSVTLIIQNPLNDKLADDVAETIFDIINRGGGMNLTIDTKIIQG